jgi:hypothetical protein
VRWHFGTAPRGGALPVRIIIIIIITISECVTAYFVTRVSSVCIISVLHSVVPPYVILCTVLFEPGSSGSIVSGYGLDARAIEVRSSAEAKDFSSSLCVQTGSGAHPASCTMGTGGPFPGVKAQPGRDADHSPPSSAKNE